MSSDFCVSFPRNALLHCRFDIFMWKNRRAIVICMQVCTIVCEFPLFSINAYIRWGRPSALVWFLVSRMAMLQNIGQSTKMCANYFPGNMMMESIRTYCGRPEKRIRMLIDRSGVGTARATNTVAVQRRN